MSLWMVALVVTGCLEVENNKPLPRRQSLYTGVGGTSKLEQLVDRLAEKAEATPELREPLRKALQEADVKKRLTHLLSAALGGPYPGTLADLQRYLGGLGGGTTPQDRAVLLRLLDESLKESGVGPKTHQEVLKTLEPLRAPPG
jgi:truncated hemoglobin YjbI